jgi:two-component system, chemotaxis family, sensor histidine kinase and response regulator PixL
MNDLEIQAQAYSYFLAEAPELLHTIEEEILTLPNEHTTAKVHNLMRALHTLKGAAANVGLATIERIAHDFEDVTRVFYNLEVQIDTSIQTLLLDGYSGLHECLTAQINEREIDDQTILDRITNTLSQLQIKLGDWSNVDIALPTAMELGFDIVASIFETTIQEQIEEVVTVTATHDPDQIKKCLMSVTDTCISLGESFELPGFVDVNQAIVAAMTEHPDRLHEVALIALVNLQQAQTEVLAGDRTIGGIISPDLAKLARSDQDVITEPDLNLAMPEMISADQSDITDIFRMAETDILQIDSMIGNIEFVAAGEAELPSFQAFLISNQFRKRYAFSTDNQLLFNQIIRLCWDWFRHEIQLSHSELILENLVTTEGLADLDYIHHWVELLLKGLDKSSPSLNNLVDNQTPLQPHQSSLYYYQRCCIYQVVFAVAKYLATVELNSQITPEFLSELRAHLQVTVDQYKQQPPATANERGWIDRIVLPHHWKVISTIDTSADLLISEIWGQADFGNNSL